MITNYYVIEQMVRDIQSNQLREAKNRRLWTKAVKDLAKARKG